MADMNNRPENVKRYKYLKTEHVRLRGFENENIAKANIECRFLEEKNKRQHYLLKITQLRQSNNKGMYGLSKDLQTLKSNIMVAVSEEGLIEAVLNMDEIKAKWQSIKNDTMKKHQSELYGTEAEEKITELLEDDRQFVNSFTYLPPFVSIFSGFSTETKTEQHYREIPFFIAKNNMPVILRTRNIVDTKIPNATQIIAEGKLDEENYEQPEVAEFVKTVRDNFRAKSDPQLRYIERYAFCNSKLPSQTLCMSTITIPGFLQQNETSILKEVL